MTEGEISGDVHTLKERVYYEHTDFSGIVYHSRYLDFLEHGRSDYVRLLGVNQKEMYEGIYGECLSFAVHHLDIRFHIPAYMGDLLIIETHKAQRKGAKVQFNQWIKRNETMLVSAELSLVLVNGEGKPRRMPKELSRVLGII